MTLHINHLLQLRLLLNQILNAPALLIVDALDEIVAQQVALDRELWTRHGVLACHHWRLAHRALFVVPTVHGLDRAVLQLHPLRLVTVLINIS